MHFVYFAVKAGVAQRYAHFTHGEPARLAAFARETVSWTFWPSLLMAMLVLALGKPMLVLFGPEFTRGYPLLFLLVFGVVARAAVGPCESLLTMSGNQNICAAVYALTLAFNIGLNVVLIPLFGLWGAAIATTFAMIFEAGALSFTVWRKLGIVMAHLRARERSRADGRRPVARGNERRPGRRHDRRPGRAGRAIADPAHVEILANNRPERKLAIYPASAGFDLVEELDYLCARTVEPNVFFNPRFLAPAMPRLEDREVRLAVIRDGDEYRSRLRLLVPFSVERPAMPLGVPVMRTWSSPFGPLGTPLVDRDDPVGVIEDFFAMLSRPHLKLPKVLVLPDMRLDGPVASLLAHRRRDARPDAGHHRRGAAAVPRERARRGRLSEGVAARASLSRVPPPEAAPRRPRQARAHGGARPRRDPPRHRKLPDAGGGRLERPRAHRHGRSTATAPPSPARPCTGCPSRTCAASIR